MNCNDALNKLAEETSALKNSDAKQRLISLFDEGSFLELDRFSKNGSDPTSCYTAYGLVGGSPCYAFSQDISVNFGAMGKMQAKKIIRLYDLAAQNGIPVVGIYDSNGAQVSEGVEALEAYSEIIAAASKISGVVPTISVIAGVCIGSSCVLASLADIVVATKESTIYVNSPKLLDDKTEKVGKAQTAAENGVVNKLAENIDDAILTVKNIFTYLPQNNLSVAPFADYIPANSFDNKDAYSIIDGVVDGGSFYELSSDFACDMVTGFARVCGNAVGVVATNAEDKYVSATGAKKAARFVRLCDAFSIPVITFVDCKGFLGGIENELAGDIKAVSTLTHAYAEATTAKISIITGYAIGAGFIALAGKTSGADSVLAYPCAVVGTLEPSCAVQLLCKDALMEGESREKLEQEYEDNDCSPFIAANEGFIDDIIEPVNTSLKVAALLEMLAGKRVNTIEKKHSNMPL